MLTNSVHGRRTQLSSTADAGESPLMRARDQTNQIIQQLARSRELELLLECARESSTTGKGGEASDAMRWQQEESRGRKAGEKEYTRWWRRGEGSEWGGGRGV